MRSAPTVRDVISQEEIGSLRAANLPTGEEAGTDAGIEVAEAALGFGGGLRRLRLWRLRLWRLLGVAVLT
jgi:hypothetical protein